MPPLNVKRAQRELEMAVAVARWFKFLAVQMPVDKWAEIAVRGMGKSYKASDTETVALIRRLNAEIGGWLSGGGKPIADALANLLRREAVSSGNVGGNGALQSLGIVQSFELTNPAVVDRLHVATLYFQENMLKTTGNLVTSALMQSAAQGLDMDQTARVIRQMVSSKWTDLSQGRARRIANTEVCRATSFVSRETYYRNGVLHMEWVTAMDKHVCPVCEDFATNPPVVTDSTGRFDSNRTLNRRLGSGWGSDHPPAHPGCRCTLTPIIPDHWMQPKEPWVGGNRGGVPMADTATIESAFESWAYESENMLAYLRGEKMSPLTSDGHRLTEEMRDSIAKQAELLKTLAEAGRTAVSELYRGESYASAAEVRNIYQVGKEVVPNRLLSTTPMEDVARTYAEGGADWGRVEQVLLRFDAGVKGTHRGTWCADGTFVTWEEVKGSDMGGEFLLAPGENYKVIDIRPPSKKDPFWLVNLVKGE